MHRLASPVLAVALALAALSASAQTPTLQPGDFIAAVVNQDVVAASEVIQRTERLRQEARQRGEVMPETAGLRKQALDALIEDRVLVTYARENGPRIDEAELDRVVANVAAQNRLTMDQLRTRLKADGLDYKSFRDNLRDQMMTERVREREVQGRIKVTDAEIDAYLDQKRAALAQGGADGRRRIGFTSWHLQLDKTDDFLRHAFLLAGPNALANGRSSPGLATHTFLVSAPSRKAQT